uniref:Uncharacterized protein n=1 Tax=Arundo donax TaxID=35708 RepID=A0A0A8Y6J2_ARUDO
MPDSSIGFPASDKCHQLLGTSIFLAQKYVVPNHLRQIGPFSISAETAAFLSLPGVTLFYRLAVGTSGELSFRRPAYDDPRF